MVMFKVCLFDNARAQLGCCATTGRKYPLTTLRTEGGADTNLARTNGVVWPCSMGRLARGRPTAASRRRGEICCKKHCNLIPRKALAAGEAAALCTLAARSTWVGQAGG
jgi:hypothetical protein